MAKEKPSDAIKDTNQARTRRQRDAFLMAVIASLENGINVYNKRPHTEHIAGVGTCKVLASIHAADIDEAEYESLGLPMTDGSVKNFSHDKFNWEIVIIFQLCVGDVPIPGARLVVPIFVNNSLAERYVRLCVRCLSLCAVHLDYDVDYLEQKMDKWVTIDLDKFPFHRLDKTSVAMREMTHKYVAPIIICGAGKMKTGANGVTTHPDQITMDAINTSNSENQGCLHGDIADVIVAGVALTFYTDSNVKSMLRGLAPRLVERYVWQLSEGFLPT